MAGHGKPRWGQPLTGIVALITFTVVALVVWWIFVDPRGPFHTYEQPFLAFMAWMILVGLWQHLLFGDYPFQSLTPPKRLLVETIINLVAVWFIINVVFGQFLGKLSMPFWSSEALHQSLPKLDHHHINEVVGAALTLFVLIGFFTYAFWTIAFQKWPFAGMKQPALGLAEWSLCTVVTVILFGILIFPHFATYLVSKEFFGETIWWKGLSSVIAGPSATVNFNIGWYEWCIVYLFMTANVWEGKPWDIVKSQPWRGIFATVSIFVLALLTVKVLMAVMASMYGPVDPLAKDGIESLDYRYYHTATLAGFTLIPFLIWNHYFDNWPKQWGVVAGWFIRTIGVFAAAAIIGVIYYKVCEPVLGLPSVLANTPVEYHGMHLNNKPLVWLFWWIIPVLWNDWFAQKWPFYVEEGHHMEHQKDKGFPA
ncbi:hypothetical protein [Desulfofundulus sp.]|uniref:hypothetical protein n=1 Tax=Desulfofundulus sp. TaxID=2282750 RepID=UPI003C71CC10